MRPVQGDPSMLHSKPACSRQIPRAQGSSRLTLGIRQVFQKGSPVTSEGTDTEEGTQNEAHFRITGLPKPHPALEKLWKTNSLILPLISTSSPRTEAVWAMG